MDPWGVPFGYRVVAAAGFLAMASVVEWARRGREATRWRDSLLIAAAACVFGIFGVGVDAITSAISPEYFAIGKRLGSASGLRARALLLGLQAGMSAGTLVGCVLVVANRLGRRPSVPGPRVLRILGWPIACSVVFALLATLLTPYAASYEGKLESIGVRDPAAFSLVTHVHSGLYLGGLVGTVAAALWILRRRVSAPTGA